jgi:hypothetical protein
VGGSSGNQSGKDPSQEVDNHLLFDMHCLTDEFCMSNNMTANPIYKYKAEASIYGVGPTGGTGFKLHTDMNTLLCDNMCNNISGCPKVQSRDLQVLTFVFSNVIESNGISLDVYYHADNSNIANRIAMMPSYGLFSWHLQGVEMNFIANHQRSEGNVPIGQGWWYTCTIHYSLIFQETQKVAIAQLNQSGFNLD